MWYPPGEDPYKSPDINRQDRFFHELNQVNEQIVRDQARISESWTKDIRAIPDRAPAYQSAIGTPAPAGASRRRTRTAARPQPTAAERWHAALKLLLFCIVVDWLLIAGGAPAWKVIAFTALAVGSLIAIALVLAALARAVDAFLRSRTGKLSLLSGGALTILYLVYGV
jgi:hypothetical protein